MLYAKVLIDGGWRTIMMVLKAWLHFYDAPRNALW
jgi:hypothetical protein